MASILETNIETWYTSFSESWVQGEHVLLCGTTGTGKTTVAHTILDNRAYVCVLAIKRHDDTLDRFRNGHSYGRPSYKIVKSWPPDYVYQRVVLWNKPVSLDVEDLHRQSFAIHKALNQMYVAGGWCIYFDDGGYITSTLGLGQALGVLLNQGRSAHISMVVAVTRPTSMVARVPKEALSQPRHKLVFKSTNDDETKAYASICGLSYRHMVYYMQQLEFHKAPKSGNRYSDFVHIGYDEPVIVRTATSSGG